jgi:hypothetical protein
MAGSVIQGCFPHGVQVAQRQQAVVSPSWVRERIAAGRQTATAPASVQPKAATPRATPNGTATPLPAHAAQLPTTGGQPLDPRVRQWTEAAFGQSFANVRVHVGPHVPAMGATAFTHGTEIHFAPGKYNPATPQGRQLLAHELAHVVQQRAGRVQNPFGSGVAVVQNPVLEAEADRMARRAAQMPAPQRAARTRQPMMRGRGVVQRAWIADHHATVRLKHWQQQQGDQENRHDGWYETDGNGGIIAGPLSNPNRIAKLKTYCTTQFNGLPYDENTLVAAYGHEGHTQTAVVNEAQGQAHATTRESIAIFRFLHANAATIDGIVNTCFAALEDDLKDSMLQEVSAIATTKIGKGLFAGQDDRADLIFGLTTMTAFLQAGKNLLTQKAAQVPGNALGAFLTDWSHNLEAKSYNRRVEALNDADPNIAVQGAQRVIGQNDGYAFFTDMGDLVAWGNLALNTDYVLFKQGTDNPGVRITVIGNAQVTVQIT